MLTLLIIVIFTTCTYFFFRDKLPINMKMLVFFLAHCVQTPAKTMVVDTKNQKALHVALVNLASKPLRTQAVCRPSSQQNRQQR